jgi:DNA (cytosine-5)-methyltransferase 1
MKHGSLFSGIGGFDLAAQWMGWTNVFHCEWNEFGQKVLKHYWPKAETFTDITKTDFTKYANKIDILTGGFPCQPYSTAGKRLGKEDERHLWPEMLRAIREIQPRWVVGENVRGLTNWNGGMVFDEVQADLEAEGYEVLPFLLPACAVNAPHRRDRIWFIAYSESARMYRKERNVCKENGGQVGELLPKSNKPSNGHGENGTTTNTNSNVHTGRLDNRGNKSEATGSESKDQQQGGWNENRQRVRVESCTSGEDASNAEQSGLERRGWKWSGLKQVGGYRNWERFPTQSPICGGNDGIPPGLVLDSISIKDHRESSLKGFGNAVVPQVVYEIFKVIEQYELLMNSSNADSNTKQIEP